MTSGSSGDLWLINGEVSVNIYDIHWASFGTSCLGLGLFHSGVVVYGSEYSFGQSDGDQTGVYKIRPRQTSELVASMRFRINIPYGKTKHSKSKVQYEIKKLGDDWIGSRYNLFDCNCNHFANYLLRFLCGKSLPGWVNRVASYSSVICQPMAPIVKLPIVKSTSASSAKLYKYSSAKSKASSASASRSSARVSAKSSSQSTRRRRAVTVKPKATTQKKYNSESTISQVKTKQEIEVVRHLTTSQEMLIETLDKLISKNDKDFENTQFEGQEVFKQRKYFTLPTRKCTQRIRPRHQSLIPKSVSAPELSKSKSVQPQPQTSHSVISQIVISFDKFPE